MSAYRFDVSDCKIAKWLGPGSYGSAMDLDAISMLEININTVSGVLEGDAQIKDTHAHPISATVRCRFAFKDLDVYALLTGTQLTESTGLTLFQVGTANFPYFALAAVIPHTQGSGDTHLFIPKLKITEGFQLSVNYGQYMTPELTMTAVDEGTSWKLFNVIEHDTAQALTIPPT